MEQGKLGGLTVQNIVNQKVENDSFITLSISLESSKFFDDLLAGTGALKEISEVFLKIAGKTADFLDALTLVAVKTDSSIRNLLALEERINKGEDAARLDEPIGGEINDRLGMIVERLDDASLTFEALVQAFGGSVERIDEASKTLRDAADDLFGRDEEPPRGFPGGGGRIIETSLVPMGARGLGNLPEVFEAGGSAAKDFGETLNSLEDIGARVFGGLEGTLERFVRTGKAEWRDLARVAIDSIHRIFETQLGASGGLGGGGLLGVLGGIGTSVFGFLGGGGPTPLQLSGPFARGGRPPVGVPALVGEEGPELFVPPGPGEIVPTDRLAGLGAGTAITVTQNFDFRGADRGAVAALGREAGRIKREVMAEIVNSARRGGAFARLPRV